MTYLLTVPARINILGNPSDANEGDFATISAAIEMRAGAIVSASDHLVFEILDSNPLTSQVYHTLVSGCYTIAEMPFPYKDELDLIKGAFNRLHQYSPEFQKKVVQKGIHIKIWSEVPRQSGLGGSSLIVILTLAALRKWYDLAPDIHNDYVISELTQRVEAKELGITAGFADRYVPLFGGLAYLDYRGKLWQKPIHEEPYVTYERLQTDCSLPIVAITTGIMHDSGDVHRRMRPRYLSEYAEWQLKGGDYPPMVQFMSKAWETAWMGKIALLSHNLQRFGELMNTNHQIVDEMMHYCGFSDGAGLENNILIQAALSNGAYGAKLTGAGGGGSVFCLVEPGKEVLIKQTWEKTALSLNLSNALIYTPKIGVKGLTITTLEQDL